MKKYAILTALALVLAVPTVAWSQSVPAPSSPPANGNWNHNGPGGQEGGQQERKEERKEKFEDRKAEILKRMNQHLEEIAKRKSCVEAATDHEALRACMPQGGVRGEGGPGGAPFEGGERGGHH
jgi:Spy/CpxP family protein refolding chaperone